MALAIIAALLLGGALGYVVRPATSVSAPAPVVVVHDGSALYASGGERAGATQGCYMVNRVKEC